MSHIGDLIQAYQDKHGTSDRALALRIGVTATLVGKWKRGAFVELPKNDRIEALAAQMSLPKIDILEAFLLDIGYIDEEDSTHGATTSNDPDGLSEARPKVAGDELRGLPSVAHKPRRGRPND